MYVVNTTLQPNLRKWLMSEETQITAIAMAIAMDTNIMTAFDTNKPAS